MNGITIFGLILFGLSFVVVFFGGHPSSFCSCSLDALSATAVQLDLELDIFVLDHQV